MTDFEVAAPGSDTKSDVDVDSKKEILLIQTGGTIDKDYPKQKGGYAFEIADCAARRILNRINVYHEFRCLCKKDSQDMIDSDRLNLARVCQEADQVKILITHGTDTMITTAEYLAKEQISKTIVITGAFLPETFKTSDAEFNVGFALGSLNCLGKHGIFIAMNGVLKTWSDVCRDKETYRFI